MPAPAAHRSSHSDAAAKVNHPWGSSYTNMHQQAQIYQQQQQQRYQQQQPAPGHAKSTHAHKAGSRVFKPAGSTDSSSTSSYTAPSQAAAAAAAATAALAAASGAPAGASSGPQAQQQLLGYSRASTSSSNGIPDRRSSTGDQYVSCYKHLGPTNMNAAAAPADAYITCLGNGSTDNGSTNSREQSGSDMLGAITSLLSDLYNMRFSGGGSNAGSRSSSRSDSHEVLSRSNSGSRKGAVAAAAADTLRNLPI